MENVLDRASALATEALTKIKAPVEKAKEESKDASKDKAVINKAESEKKVEGNIADVEAKAKEDERILSADDKNLTEPEAKRKAEILETKNKKAESPEDKIKRTQEASQKRIDEIKSEMLAKENQSNEKIKKLEAEMAELKKSMQPRVDQDEKSRLKALEAERINKYIEEDKGKPLVDRREMSKEDLETWYLEDPVEATAWMQERTLRRVDDRKRLSEENTNNKAKELADDFIKKQNESLGIFVKKYPDVRPNKTKLSEVIGKSDEEVDELMANESVNARLAVKIVNSNPKKYLESVNGPELVMAEMDKRLNNSNGKPKTVTLTEEELEAKIQAEAERRANLDEGVTSTKGKKVENKIETKSEKREHLEKIAKKANISMEALDKTIARRRTIPGSGTFEDGND